MLSNDRRWRIEHRRRVRDLGLYRLTVSYLGRRLFIVVCLVLLFGCSILPEYQARLETLTHQNLQLRLSIADLGARQNLLGIESEEHRQLAVQVIRLHGALSVGEAELAKVRVQALDDLRNRRLTVGAGVMNAGGIISGAAGLPVLTPVFAALAALFVRRKNGS